jgi:hypothetical protein
MDNDARVANLPLMDLQQNHGIRYYLKPMQQLDSLGTGARQWQKVLRSRMEWVQSRLAAAVPRLDSTLSV